MKNKKVNMFELARVMDFLQDMSDEIIECDISIPNPDDDIDRPSIGMKVLAQELTSDPEVDYAAVGTFMLHVGALAMEGPSNHIKVKDIPKMLEHVGIVQDRLTDLRATRTVDEFPTSS